MRSWFLVAALALAPQLAWADPATERLYKAKCGACHGPDGKGQTDQGKKAAVSDFTTAEWQSKFTDDQIKAAIENGVKREKNGVKQEMEGYKAKLRPDQVTALVAHIRSLKK